MNITNRWAVVAALVLILGAGAYDWILTGYPRWAFGGVHDPEATKNFAAAMDKVPMVIGEWEGTDAEPSDPRELATAGIDRQISRAYKNKRTGEVVSLFLVTGHHRNISQHTPNQCYVAAGFKMTEDEISYDVPTGSDTPQFYTTMFRREKNSGAEEKLRVFWTWSSEGVWEAPKASRWAFVGIPALYKMYLITDEAGKDRTIEECPSLDFTRECMPTITKALFGDKNSDQAAEGAVADAA